MVALLTRSTARLRIQRRSRIHGLVAVALVLLLFVLRWRAPTRPALEFTMLLAMVATTFGLAQWQGVQLWQLNEIPIMVFTLSTHIQTIQLLVLPLLFLIGVDIAGFTGRAASWTAGLVAERLPRTAPPVVLCLLLLWRLRDVGSETAARITRDGLRAEIGIYAHALLGPVLVAFVWWLVRRLGRSSSSASPNVGRMREAVERRAMPLILAYTAISIVFALCLSLAAALPTLARLAGDTMAGVRLSQAIVGTASSLHDAMWQPWRLLVDCSAVVLALWLARRGHAALAVFLGIFGLLDLHRELMMPGLRLARFSPVDFWWVAILAAVTLTLAARRQLSAPRATSLLVVTLITALLRQTDFIEDPFSPFFWLRRGCLNRLWHHLGRSHERGMGQRKLPRAAARRSGLALHRLCAAHRHRD